MVYILSLVLAPFQTSIWISKKLTCKKSASFCTWPVLPCTSCLLHSALLESRHSKVTGPLLPPPSSPGKKLSHRSYPALHGNSLQLQSSFCTIGEMKMFQSKLYSVVLLDITVITVSGSCHKLFPQCRDTQTMWRDWYFLHSRSGICMSNGICLKCRLRSWAQFYGSVTAHKLPSYYAILPSPTAPTVCVSCIKKASFRARKQRTRPTLTDLSWVSLLINIRQLISPKHTAWPGQLCSLFIPPCCCVCEAHS